MFCINILNKKTRAHFLRFRHFMFMICDGIVKNEYKCRSVMVKLNTSVQRNCSFYTDGQYQNKMGISSCYNVFFLLFVLHLKNTFGVNILKLLKLAHDLLKLVQEIKKLL